MLKLPEFVHDLFQDARVEAAGGQRLDGVMGEGEGLVVGLVELVALPDEFDVVVPLLGGGDDGPEVSHAADPSGQHLHDAQRDDRLAALRFDAGDVKAVG